MLLSVMGLETKN